MKMSKSAWPVMIVSQELNLGNDNGVRLREIAAELEHVQECKVIPSFTYEDAWELFLSRACPLKSHAPPRGPGLWPERRRRREQGLRPQPRPGAIAFSYHHRR